MSNDWHGHEQHPDARPGRPWWRTDGHPLAFVRSDGLRANGDPAMLAEVDCGAPLPVPTPRCGQVWVWPDGRQALITWVREGAACAEGTVYEIESGAGVWPAWPPPGAVLVAGPGSPWADTRSPSVSEPVTDRRACGRCGWQGVERDVVDQRCPQCGTIGGVVVSYVRRAEVTP